MREILREVTVWAIIDMVILWLGLYAGLVSIRRTGAGRAMYGIALVALLYIVALELNLVLTTTVLQAFFAVFLIAMVVIFREELRRFLEALAQWGRPRPLRRPLTRAEHVTIVKTLGELAAARVGALILLRGRDALDLHLQGGVELDGAISGELLRSIFDPHSAGHDGAVVVEGTRVTRFGCHLPLSARSESVRGRGTRHSAAVGITERTDSLCLVVSEETGTISAAFDGELHEVSSIQECEDRITQFYSEHPTERRPFTALVTRDWTTKALAATLAAGMWLVIVYGGRPQQLTTQVPIQVTGPRSEDVIAIEPQVATLTLSGPRRSFYGLRRDPAVIVEVPARSSHADLRLRLRDQRLEFARGVELVRIEPEEIRLQFRAPD